MGSGLTLIQVNLRIKVVIVIGYKLDLGQDPDHELVDHWPWSAQGYKLLLS